jgi:pimeloyl-ACP methyl ester carboxylesterase
MVTKVMQVELKGRIFQYRETGAPSAPPLIALHGLCHSAESWDSVAAVLGQKYRVLALDQRGHGGSAKTGEYSFELMCEDVEHFANVMELERFTLMGHSMGGTVSYLFTERYPSRIKQLVVVDTPPPFISRKIEVPPRPSGDLPFDWLVVPAIIQQLNEPDPEWWTRLNRIAAPTLIVGGGSASHVPQEKLVEVSDLIPTCELVTIEGAGHDVHHADLPAFLTAVRKFLNAFD